MDIDTQTLRRNLKSLQGHDEEWSRNQREILIRTLLEMLDGLEDVGDAIDDLG